MGDIRLPSSMDINAVPPSSPFCDALSVVMHFTRISRIQSRFDDQKQSVLNQIKFKFIFILQAKSGTSLRAATTVPSMENRPLSFPIRPSNVNQLGFENWVRLQRIISTNFYFWINILAIQMEETPGEEHPRRTPGPWHVYIRRNLGCWSGRKRLPKLFTSTFFIAAMVDSLGG